MVQPLFGRSPSISTPPPPQTKSIQKSSNKPRKALASVSSWRLPTTNWGRALESSGAFGDPEVTRAGTTRHATNIYIYHIISYHIISYHIISYHIISYHTIPYHIISYHIISYHITSHHITSYHIISYHTIPYHIISYHIISYHIVSYHIISYHIISYHIISYHILLVCRFWGFSLNPQSINSTSWSLLSALGRVSGRHQGLDGFMRRPGRRARLCLFVPSPIGPKPLKP